MFCLIRHWTHSLWFRNLQMFVTCVILPFFLVSLVLMCMNLSQHLWVGHNWIPSISYSQQFSSGYDASALTTQWWHDSLPVVNDVRTTLGFGGSIAGRNPKDGRRRCATEGDEPFKTKYYHWYVICHSNCSTSFYIYSIWMSPRIQNYLIYMSSYGGSPYAYWDRFWPVWRDEPESWTERSAHLGKGASAYNGSPHMHTGTVKIPVCILWLIGDKSPHAYGDSTEPNTHTGIDQSLTVCIMYSCAYGKLGIWPPYAKVCIWGLPYAYGKPRTHTGRDC